MRFNPWWKPDQLGPLDGEAARAEAENIALAKAAFDPWEALVEANNASVREATKRARAEGSMAVILGWPYNR